MWEKRNTDALFACACPRGSNRPCGRTTPTAEYATSAIENIIRAIVPIILFSLYENITDDSYTTRYHFMWKFGKQNYIGHRNYILHVLIYYVQHSNKKLFNNVLLLIILRILYGILRILRHVSIINKKNAYFMRQILIFCTVITIITESTKLNNCTQ